MKICTLNIILLISFTLLSCNNKEVQKEPALNSIKKAEVSNKENFEEFNKKFHSDSLFQVSRIDFPIEGKHVYGFEQYSWSRKNWQFQAVPVAEKSEIGEYQHSLIKTDTLIIEKFWIPDSGFEVERQFKLIKNKWFLIYYNDINL